MAETNVVPINQTQAHQANALTPGQILRSKGEPAIHAFLRRVMELADVHGMTYETMVEKGSLREFFDGAHVTTPQKLKDLIGGVCVSGSAPEWFIEWRRHHRGRRKPEGTKKNLPTGRVKKSTVRDVDADGTEALANIYATENDQLKATIKDLEKALAMAALVKKAVPESDLRTVVGALETLAAQGLIDAVSVLKAIKAKLNLT